VELHRLHTRWRGLQLVLGAAAYEEDEEEMAELRTRLRELDATIARCEREALAAKRRARRQVEHRRTAIRPTRQLR
jgi:hypothetical protein